MVCRKHQLGLPQDSRDAFRLLQQANLIDAIIAIRMQAMVGFRNIAVHQYQALSIPVLQAILDNHLADFTDFTQVLLRR